LKKLFQVTSPKNEKKQPVLCMRIGDNFFSFAVIDAATDELKNLYYYSFEKKELFQPGELFQLHPCLRNGFTKVLLCYDSTESMLLPTLLTGDDNPEKVMTVIFGQQVINKPFIDTIAGVNISSCFIIPEGFNEWVNSNFSNVLIKSKESVLLGAIAETKGQEVFINFRNDFYDLFLLADEKVLMSRTSRFTCPEDLLFRLLKYCELYGLNQDTLQLHLSGLIEKQSVLYKYLHDYFIHINFREVSWRDETYSYPAHFFTAINDLYLCAL